MEITIAKIDFNCKITFLFFGYNELNFISVLLPFIRLFVEVLHIRVTKRMNFHYLENRAGEQLDLTKLKYEIDRYTVW